MATYCTISLNEEVGVNKEITMIKIIKQGKIPVKHKEITCHYCNTIFSYEQDDIVCEDRPCAMPYVSCPLCGKRNNTMRNEPNKW